MRKTLEQKQLSRRIWSEAIPAVIFVIFILALCYFTIVLGLGN